MSALHPTSAPWSSYEGCKTRSDNENLRYDDEGARLRGKGFGRRNEAPYRPETAVSWEVRPIVNA